MQRLIFVGLLSAALSFGQYFPPAGGGGGGGGATIPSVTNVIKGDGAGNGADSGIAPAAVVLTSGSYSNPGWITALANAKITGLTAFATLATGTSAQYVRGDGTTQTLNAAAVANAADTTSTYSNPGWITALANAKITGLTAFATLATAASSTYVRGDATTQTLNCAALSNAATSCATDTTNATNINAGTLANARLTGAGSTTVNGQTCTLGSSCTIPLSAINPETATYQVLAGDFSNYKAITVASGTFTVTLVASGSQPAAGQYINVINYGTGVVTIARSGQNINGGTTSLTLAAGSATAPTSTTVFSDGTNYFASLSAASSGGTPITYAVGTFAGLPSCTNVLNEVYEFTDSIYHKATCLTGQTSWTYLINGKSRVIPVSGNFTWMNQQSSTVTTTNGGMNIFTPKTGSTSTNQVSIFYIAYPSAPFTLDACGQQFGEGEDGMTQNAGIGISDGTKVELFMQQTTINASAIGTLSHLGLVTGPTVTNISANILSPANVATNRSDKESCFRLNDDATNRNWSYSGNGGITWQLLKTETNTTFLTATRLGVFQNPLSATYGGNFWVTGWNLH